LKYIKELKRRNPLLFYATIVFTAIFIAFLISYQACGYVLYEICHWLKPGKFAISFAIYTATMGWYMEYLKDVLGNKSIRNLSIALAALSFMEMASIVFESWLTSGSLYSKQISQDTVQWLSRALYLSVNTMIITSAIITGYIGLQFFKPINLKPHAYLLGIRAGFIVFLVSSALGGYLIERYGQMPLDGSHFGIPFTRYGTRRDILISLHFLGIHYLQLLPICCYLFDKYMKKAAIMSSVGIYFLICLYFII